MTFNFRAVFAAAMIAATATSTAALAHTKLVSSTPAANATVDKPGKIVLVFNEKLMAKFAGAELTMTGMPGMADHQPMKMTGFTTALGADGKTLTLLMKRALPSGSYELKWFAAGADAHRMEGSFPFTVK
jgi:methionine-rich copper-binding protein CopC